MPRSSKLRAWALGLAVVALTLLPGVGIAAAPGTPTPAAGPTSTPAPTATPAAAALSVSPTPAADADPFRDRENRLALLVARTRVNAGLLPLARSVELDRAAVEHAQEMTETGNMDHTTPDGSTPDSRAARDGYHTPPGSAWLVVETISAISDEPEGAMGWWLGDALHRRVVLRSTWREMGLGFAPGGPYGRFWVALFGCRPNVLPPVLLDGVLSIPDETCGRSSDTFGSVQSIRAGSTTGSVKSQDWQAYSSSTSQQAWPAGQPAVVDLQDAAGDQLEVQAMDPTGALTQAP